MSEMSQAEMPAKVSAGRSAAIDAWRFVAAVGIVWIHAQLDAVVPNSSLLGRFAVPFFSGAAAFLLYESVQRNPGRDFGAFAIGRVKRIYFPFLAWSVIYLLATELKRRFVSHEPMVPLGWSFLFAGTSLQLWFLPFILVAMVGLFPFCRWVVGLSAEKIRMVGVGLILMGVVICFLPRPSTAEAGLVGTMASARYVLRMSWDTFPALLVGLALPMVGVYRGMKIVPIVGMVLLVAATGMLFVTGREFLLENLAGVGALLAAMTASDGAVMRRVGNWGRGAYGIYLAHVLFLEGFFAVESAGHIRITVLLKMMEFLGALGLSCGLVWVLNRSSWTRWLAGE